MFVCTSFLTFININALTVFKFESLVTFANPFTVFLDTVAMDTTINTLADVNFIAFVDAIAGEASFTFTSKTTFVINAVCILVAVVFLFGTFVYVITVSAIIDISESRWTLTCEASVIINACCTSITIMSSFVTFVNILTFSIFKFETSIAFAYRGVIFFNTSATISTVNIFAVIDIVTVDTVTRETRLAFT